MDPFVTQIGDVTIQRVAPQSSSPEVLQTETNSNTSSNHIESLDEPANSPPESKTEEIKTVTPPDPNNLDEKQDSPSLEEGDAKNAENETVHDDIQDEQNDTSEENKTSPKETPQPHCEEDSEKEKLYDEGEVTTGVVAEMDASEFLAMSQAERDNDDGSENEVIPPVLESFMKCETSDKESDVEREHLSEDGEKPQNRVKRKLKSSDEMKLEPNDESEAMEDSDNVNGDIVDSNFGVAEFDGMEVDSMALAESGDLLGVKEEGSEDQDQHVSHEEQRPSQEHDSDKKADEGADQDESDIKKKLRTRQKRKILVDEETDESEEERRKKRKKRKKKGGQGEASESTEASESEDDGSGKKKKKRKKKLSKKKKKDDDDDGSGGEKSEKKTSFMRRNIRDVMDETQLDEATLAAQRQEMERLRRVQEQQRILREMAHQKQQQQRAEHKVMSLLQGNTSILKQVTVGPSQPTKTGGSATSPNTVVVKVGSGTSAQSNRKVLELLRVPKGTSPDIKPSVTKTLISKPLSQGTAMVTPSVSIAPVRPGTTIQKPAAVVKHPSMIQAQASYSASEGEGEGEEDEEEEEFDEDDVIEEGDDEGKKKKKDVVTISSSSEDDCIVLSEPSDAGEDEEEEDPTNSGMHTNDAYNVPDEEGRVQVNMGKPEGDPDIFLAPHIARIIKPHQIGGIRFLYDNVIESIERFSTSTGFGCILAHSMGLGKTLQVITFCDIFLRHTPAKTVLCIMPINTLQNWLAEFNMWMPDDPLATPLAAQGEVRPRTFGIHVLNDSHKTLKARAKVVEDWSTNGGVLLIGYEMYRQLSLKKVSKPKKSRRKKVPSDDEDLDPEEEEKRQKEILEKVYEALVKPGPDLVICDEGHRIKNSHASISMALKQIRSKRRIVLTGYPLQNNLLEYWCMVDFVRPNYLGTKTEFSNMFERPIQNGQCIDSTPQDIRLMRYRAHVLHSLLEGFVQRRSHAVLQTALPQKEEYVLLVRMTPFQRKLYDTFMNEVVRTKAVPNPLKAFAVCCKIWNHPDVLYQFLKKREGGEGVDLDLEEAAAALAANTVADPTGTPVEERKATTKARNRSGSGKGRKKKETSASKPNSTVMPNTSSQSDANSPYGLASQYPIHGQINSNSMMGSYSNPYSSPGQAPYGSFNAPSHHYNPNSSYGHSGYSGTSGFGSNSSNLGLNSSAQTSYSGSGSSGYGDSLASSPASQSSQYGSSSSQSIFNNSTPSNPAPAGSSGYGSMGPPYFSGNNSSGQHAMSDGFSSSSSYGQSGWSGSSNYNSFNQPSSGSQSFSGSSYNATGQNPSYQGYGGSSTSSFNQSMYSSGSGGGSATGSSQSYQPGLMDQQMLDQNLMAPPNRPNVNPNLIPQQSPVNASGMLPGGAPGRNATGNMFTHQSPINAPGMLPGGAPTKNPAMMPANMGSSLMGPGMGVGMNSGVPTISSMGESLLGHDSRGMSMSGVYQNPNMMNMQAQPPNHTSVGPMAALASMSSADMPPSAEDLLHSAPEDFRAFDPSLGKQEPPRSMFDVKDRPMFDPWGSSHSHPQDYSMISNLDVKSMKNSDLKNVDNGPSSLEQLKNDVQDIKLEDKVKSDVDSKEISTEKEDGAKNRKQEDPEEVNASDSWKVNSMEIVDKDKEIVEESKEKEAKDDDDDASAINAEGKASAETPIAIKQSGKEDPGIPYDWAVELMKDYVPGLIENAGKMVLFFCMLEESLALGDRILLFSQSLFTLSLIEEYLQRSYIPVPGVYERWQRNKSYFRLDGSTAAIEREKLINEFNANPNVHLFLVSTRAGSLGINLVGANRVIVFDASWNPCHDTQAVCRVYRYGQKKPCYVYRLVMDNCLEKKIYDRQINKQGMSDRVVDECNPDAHLSIKEVTNLCWDDEKETEVKDLSGEKENYSDPVMQKVLEKHGKLLTKAPFQHESLLVDRKDKKLSQAEKRLAKRSYEMEKRANNKPVYNYYNPAQGGLQIRPLQRDAAGNVIKPIANVRPLQTDMNSTGNAGNRNTKWIPAEVWQRQGMSAQEMTLPLDVVIPTNSPERSSIVLKAGQRVMVLKSPKGIYMQLENGKIIAIRTAFKTGVGNKADNKPFAGDKEEPKKGPTILNKGNIKLTSGIHPLRNNPNITITPRASPGAVRPGIRPIINRPPGMRMQTTSNMRPWVRPGGVAGRAVPLRPNQNLRPGIRGLGPSVTVTPANSKSRSIGPVTITPRLAPATNFPGTKNLVDGSKDKVKTDMKVESKIDQTEKLGSDDGNNSNSSSEAPSSSSKASTVNDVIFKSDLENHDKKEEKVAFASNPIRGVQEGPKSQKDNQGADIKSSDGRSNSASTPNPPGSSLSDPLPKSFQSSSNQHQQNFQSAPPQESREHSGGSLAGPNSSFSGGSVYSSSEKGISQASSTSYSVSGKQFSSNMQGGSLMSPPSYNSSGDHSVDDSKSSGSIERQWKSPSAPQPFSPGVPGSKQSSHQKSILSPGYDDNSNASVHSNISSKSSTAHVSNVEPRRQTSSDTSTSQYPTDFSVSLSKTSSKLPSPSTSSQNSAPNSKSNPPHSTTSSGIPTTSASSFPTLDSYANLYGSYGAYAGGLPSSNYYSPYGYPPSFLQDPKSTLSSKTSSEPHQNASLPASRSSSKSSTSRSESKKSSHDASRSCGPPAYDGRQSSSSGMSSSSTHSSRTGSSSSSATAAAVSSSSSIVSDPSYPASSASAYNPMMMSPSFNPTPCQYPPSASAASSTNPFTAAAAAAANYPSPYASPYGYPPTNQFESDLARASMYSAFHRPEAGLDPTSPYLPLPAHSRPMTGAPPPSGSFYSQNMYGSQYGSTRDPYAQLPPYPASPLFMPPGPYGSLASSTSSTPSTATSDQASNQ